MPPPVSDAQSDVDELPGLGGALQSETKKIRHNSDDKQAPEDQKYHMQHGPPSSMMAEAHAIWTKLNISGSEKM
jgi:hypothetical protein